MPKVAIKRAYERAAKSDGQRVLVDRVWPRGVTKKKLGDVIWMKEVAPSTDLRKWFGHKPERWAEFRKRYRSELKGNAALKELRALAKKSRITLIYGAKDEEHNQAVVLAQLLGVSK